MGNKSRTTQMRLPQTKKVLHSDENSKKKKKKERKKSQLQNGTSYFASDIYDKGLIFKICKELSHETESASCSVLSDSL